MKKTVNLKGFQVVLLIIIAALVGYFYGTNKVHVAWKNYLPVVLTNTTLPPSSQSLDLQLLYSVIDKVNSQYYDKGKVDTQKMLYGAITGMLSSLDDPYTAFFPPKQNLDFKTQLAGEFSGIGAELSLSSDNKIQVTAPLDGSPAKKAGIRSGDLIVKVNGENTNGWTLSQAVEKIRGKKGTKVILSVLHENQKDLVDLEIVRDTITIKSVKGWIKKVQCAGDVCAEEVDCVSCASVAYIRLSQFGDKTNSEWIEVVNSLYPQMQKEKNFKGIILDVRNNPGGYLADAVFIASEFLESGVVVTQTDSSGGTTDLHVNRTGLLTKYPIVVLINKGSASASEILSGALRDQKKSLLLGEKSFGKGTIQQASDLDDGASVHVSVGKWLTPAGTWVHGQGLTPDVEIIFDAEKSKDQTKFDNQLQGAVKELLK